jgi:hypothetical protein
MEFSVMYVEHFCASPTAVVLGVVLAITVDGACLEDGTIEDALGLGAGLGATGAGLVADVYARVCSCRQCWASKCRGL